MPMTTFLSITLDTSAGANLFNILTDAKELAEYTGRRVDFRFNGFPMAMTPGASIQAELTRYDNFTRSQKDACYAYRSVTGRMMVGHGDPPRGVCPVAYGPRWSMETYAESENKK